MSNSVLVQLYFKDLLFPDLPAAASSAEVANMAVRL